MVKNRDSIISDETIELKPVDILLEDLDMSGTWDTHSQAEKLADRLRSLGLKPEELLYIGNL